MVFHLRRHKLDDYRGQYRIWIWGTCCLVIASLDAVTGVHSATAGLTALLPLYGGALCLLVSVLVSAYLGLRLLRETWRCRTAAVLFLLAAAAYATALSFRLGIARLEGQTLEAIVNSTSLLLAHFLILMALAVYCRFVYFEAQGLARKKEAAVVDADPTTSGDAERQTSIPAPRVSNRPTIRIDTAHEDPGPVRPAAAELSTEQEAASGPLSKAERRQLRKQLRRRR
jgi:hypothetical protein